MALAFYKCDSCADIAVKVVDDGCGLTCCGEEMKKIEANSTDAATEKHVPVITVNGNTVHVEVGSTLHPMTEEHYITFIAAETERGFQVVELTPADEPKADFVLVDGDKLLRVYENCNLHGLWVAEA